MFNVVFRLSYCRGVVDEDEQTPSCSGHERVDSLRRTGRMNDDDDDDEEDHCHSVAASIDVCSQTTQIKDQVDEMTVPKTENSERT